MKTIKFCMLSVIICLIAGCGASGDDIHTSFQVIDGKDCIVLEADDKLALSCDWSKERWHDHRRRCRGW